MTSDSLNLPIERRRTADEFRDLAACLAAIGDIREGTWDIYRAAMEDAGVINEGTAALVAAGRSRCEAEQIARRALRKELAPGGPSPRRL